MNETATAQVLVTYRVALPTGRVLRWDGMNLTPPLMAIPDSNPREVAEFVSEASAWAAVKAIRERIADQNPIGQIAAARVIWKSLTPQRIEWTDKGEAWGAAVRAKNTAQAAAILTAESWPEWLGGARE